MSKTTEPATDPVPLAHLVLEGVADSIDELAGRLDDVVLDELGRRCVARDVAAALITAHRLADEQQRALRERQQAETTRRCAEAQALVPRGVRAPDDLKHLPAVAVLGAVAHEERLEEQGSTLDEMFSGSPHFHSLAPKEEES